MSDNEQKNETVDDVLAEMLERADAMQTHGTTHGVRLAIREFVNRIKAAWKRERSKVEADALAVGGIVEAARRREATAEKSSAVGNAAAMREAILAIKDINDRRPHDADGYEINDIINASLSAPARNCDMYDDAETAWRAWLEDKDNWDEFGSPELELCEWLFASAKKKGENDGIK